MDLFMNLTFVPLAIASTLPWLALGYLLEFLGF